jgi:hypothetical protein
MNKPKNLKECIEELDRILSESDKETIRSMDKGLFASTQHFGMGVQIRNSWGLWDETSELYKYFHEKLSFAYHADEVSGLILRTFHEHLQGKTIDFDNKVDSNV